MKRLLLSVIACAALSFSLIGCGGGGGGGKLPTQPTLPYKGIYEGTFQGTPGHVTKIRLNVSEFGTVKGHTDNDFAAASFSGNINSTGKITTNINERVRDAIDPDPIVYITIYNIQIANDGSFTGSWVYTNDATKTGSLSGTKVTIPNPRFTAINNGTIVDNIQGGRTWLLDTKCAALNPGNTTSTGASAEQLVATTLKDGVCGLNNISPTVGLWELPTYYDMMSLVEDGYTPDTLLTAGFTSMFTDPYYWGEDYAFDLVGAGEYWYINMGTGAAAKSNSSSAYVWPVLK